VTEKEIRKYSHDRLLSGLESNLSCLGYVAGTIFDIVEVRTPEQDAGKAFCIFRPLDKSQVRHPRDIETKQLSVDERDRRCNLGGSTFYKQFIAGCFLHGLRDGWKHLLV